MPETSRRARGTGGSTGSGHGGEDRAGRQGRSPDTSARPESIVVEARSFEIQLPDHPIYGEDARDPGARLLAGLIEVGERDAVLVVGGGSGLVPVVAARLARWGKVVVFTDQLPEAKQVEEALRLNRVAAARVARAADLSDLRDEVFDVAILGTALEPSRETLALHVRQAALCLRPGGRLYLHGGKREGIESAAGLVREVLGNVATLGYKKGHRVLVSERGESVHADWDAKPPSVVEVGVGGEQLEIETRPGVFAGGALDEGTRVLVEALVVNPGDEALDLGCGSGIVGLYIARRATAGRVVLADSDLGAVELARRNAARNGVGNTEIVSTDGYSALAERRFDLIACNPPFHVGRIQSTAVVEGFVAEAPAHLRPGGRLYLVANRFRRYESLFPDAFERPEAVAETSRYRVLRATIGRPEERRSREDADAEAPLSPEVRGASERTTRRPGR